MPKTSEAWSERGRESFQYMMDYARRRARELGYRQEVRYICPPGVWAHFEHRTKPWGTTLVSEPVQESMNRRG